MTGKAAPAAAEALGHSGFFFGGLLPEYREGDVLRLQRLVVRGGLPAIPVLSSASARVIAEAVRRDAERVAAD